MFACSVLGKAGAEGSVKCWILRGASYFLTFASQGEGSVDDAGCFAYPAYGLYRGRARD